SNPTTNSALTGLTQNSGGLYLYNGAKITTNGLLTNTGTISLDQFTGNGGASLAVNGLLANRGTLNVGPANNTLSAPDTVSAASIDNTGGAINLWGSSTALAE